MARRPRPYPPHARPVERQDFHRVNRVLDTLAEHGTEEAAKRAESPAELTLLNLLLVHQPASDAVRNALTVVGQKLRESRDRASIRFTIR